MPKSQEQKLIILKFILLILIYFCYYKCTAISKLQARAYVFRLLLHRLPPSNYTLLKNIMYLFSCIGSIESNKKAYLSQIIDTLGPLLLKRSNDEKSYYR